MTDVRASCGEHERETEPGPGPGRVPEQPGHGGYLEVLRLPGALRFSVAGAIGRVPMAMFGLGTLLLVASLTGQYGVAGAVASAGSVGYAISSALAARLIDRFGQARVLRPSAVIFAVTTAAFVACAELRAPLAAVLVTGFLAGASMPSVGLARAHPVEPAAGQLAAADHRLRAGVRRRRAHLRLRPGGRHPAGYRGPARGRSGHRDGGVRRRHAGPGRADRHRAAPARRRAPPGGRRAAPLPDPGPRRGRRAAAGPGAGHTGPDVLLPGRPCSPRST